MSNDDIMDMKCELSGKCDDIRNFLHSIFYFRFSLANIVRCTLDVHVCISFSLPSIIFHMYAFFKKRFSLYWYTVVRRGKIIISCSRLWMLAYMGKKSIFFSLFHKYIHSILPWALSLSRLIHIFRLFFSLSNRDFIGFMRTVSFIPFQIIFIFIVQAVSHQDYALLPASAENINRIQ